MYKPNFCAECGGRITRLRWRAWTSRRFCDACDRRFRKARMLLPPLACAALLGVGYVGGRAMRPAPAPLVIERNAVNSPASPSKIAATEKGTGATVAAGTRDANSHAYGADGTATERPTDPAEVVSICGARTKKGTPCSRRVRGTGRCWQHRGMPAMLPAAKLIIRE